VPASGQSVWPESRSVAAQNCAVPMRLLRRAPASNQISDSSDNLRMACDEIILITGAVLVNHRALSARKILFYSLHVQVYF
jgi:hypothetical protein